MVAAAFALVVVHLHECRYGVVVVCTDGGVVCTGVKVLHARVSGVSFCAGVQVLSLYMSLQCCCLCRCLGVVPLSVFMVLFALVFGCFPSA